MKEKNINDMKIELETAIYNSVWNNDSLNLSYKFQNENDLWINSNAHFYYKIEIENNLLILKFFPNGKNYFIKLEYGEIIHLHDEKDNFELRLNKRL